MIEWQALKGVPMASLRNEPEGAGLLERYPALQHLPGRVAPPQVKHSARNPKPEVTDPHLHKHPYLSDTSSYQFLLLSWLDNPKILNSKTGGSATVLSGPAEASLARR